MDLILRRKLLSPVDTLALLGAGLLLTFCLRDSIALAAEVGREIIPEVKVAPGSRALIRAAPQVPKRGAVGRPKRTEPRQTAEKWGVDEANRPDMKPVRRRATIHGRPTPAVPIQAPPPVEFTFLSESTGNAAQPGPSEMNHGETDQPEQIETLVHDRHAAENAPARHAMHRHHVIPRQRRPIGRVQSPTLMRSQATSTIGRRLPHGFAARISSFGDNGQRPVPAVREIVAEDDRWKLLRPAAPTLNLGRAQRAGVRRGTPQELLSIERPPVNKLPPEPAPPTQPISSFIIVAPPEDIRNEARQDHGESDHEFEATSTPSRARRVTVSAEYNGAQLRASEGVHSQSSETVLDESAEKDQKPWPLSAFTAARWGAQSETKGSRFAQRESTREADPFVDPTGGIDRLIHEVAEPGDDRQERPVRNDQSRARVRSRQSTANKRIGLRTTQLVTLVQRTDETDPGAGDGILNAPRPATVEYLPNGMSSETRSVHSIEASIELPTGILPPDATAERFAAAGEIEHSTGTSMDVVETLVLWDAAATSHRDPLFEDVNLERHGYSAGIFQPAFSAAHFFGRVPALPYLMAADGIGQCYYTLGHFRPGSCAPYQVYLPPLTLKGLTAEATSVMGMLFLIP